MTLGKTEKKKIGRPATGRDPSVTIRLPVALLEWIDGEARNKEIGRSDMIRRLIEESRLGVPGKERRIRTAYHEAGHAVMARALGVALEKVSIIHDDTSLGYASYGGERSIRRSNLEEVATHIMILMAGREAEQMVLGFWHDDKGDKGDRREIRKFAGLLSIPGEPDHVLQKAETEQVLDMLRSKTYMSVMMDLKKSIRAVAEALLRSNTLDQKRVDAILVKTGEKVCDWSHPGNFELWDEHYAGQRPRGSDAPRPSPMSG